MSTSPPIPDGDSTLKHAKPKTPPILFCTALGGILGGVGGLLANELTVALGYLPTLPWMTAWQQQAIYTGKLIRGGNMSFLKPAVLMGCSFGATESALAKARGKSDSTTTTIAGCVSGASVTAKYGPKTACTACALFGGVAAFAFNSAPKP